MEPLTERQRALLKIIVGDYISSAMPVASELVAGKYTLKVSPATIRNEMAALEELGLVTHPHTSAGRVPTDKGYRYYVESLMEEAELPQVERLMIQHQFHQVELELDQWLRLAMAILAHSVQSAALITPPVAARSRVRHFELISVQEDLALMVLVLQGGTVKEQMLSFDRPLAQGELSAIANRLNSLFQEATAEQIQGKLNQLGGLERQVAEVLVKIVRQLDELGHQEVYHNGLINVLSQPEFSQVDRARQILELLEQRSFLSAVMPQVLMSEGVQVIIGAENPWEKLRQFSMVLSRYGVKGEAAGVLGVLGPTRLPYWRAISTVRFMAQLMSGLLGELYGER
ncbi:MAG: heat-inducible transcription repressor HrcA [Chloroflexi bacterium]|nr:heat-inducible transcription repressor HrcA [Chloroflexota bacterium]